MLNSQKWIKVILLVFIALLGTQRAAFAESMNNSVKDCIEHKEKCQDSGPAAQKQSSETTKAATVGVTFWDFIRMIFALAFVVALLYFLLKFINKKSRTYKSSQLVENLGGTSLGANRSVQIIKVANQVLVVGVGGESIQLLKEIVDPEEQRQILDEYNSKVEQLVQPSDIVTKMIERTKNRHSKKDSGSSSFSSLLKKQLDDLSNGRKKIFEEMEKKGPDKR